MIKTDKNIRGSFKDYKKESENPVDIKDYISLCNGYNQFIMDKVIEGHEVVLPQRLGLMSIIGNKIEVRIKEDGTPNLAPDWVRTKILWEKSPESREKKKLVYHTNDHTEGVRYRLAWYRVLVRNKTLYSFRLTRNNKRRIHKEIIKGTEYLIK